VNEVLFVGRVYGLVHHLCVSCELIITVDMVFHCFFVLIEPVVENACECQHDGRKCNKQNERFNL